MYSITQTYTSDYRIKGSKFLGFLSPADTTEAAEKYLEEIKTLHPTATHHCYAFRIEPGNVTEFSQDDGEPSGTAGPPILNMMRSSELFNAIAIVVRYYGGTHLGKSGLIDAYGKATDQALENAKLKRIVPTQQFSVTYPYNQQSAIDKLKHTFTLFEIDANYAENVTLQVECPQSEQAAFYNSLLSMEHLSIDVERIGQSYHIHS
ncbi:MAG: YigZ family protein [Balneolaceae bacterium]